MRTSYLVSLCVMPFCAAPVLAGMPNVTLTDAASMRLQSISFFLMVFLVSAVFIRWIWNSFAAEYPRLPRLSIVKSLGLVGLWGLLFVLVLTMISGARELMTPGAWKKDGLTYTLNEENPPKPSDQRQAGEPERRQQLTELFTALSAYAEANEGRFPPEYDTAIPNHLWRTPHQSGMRYIYVSGRVVDQPKQMLACEPELFGERRLVLFTTGDIRAMSTAELTPLLTTGVTP